MLNVVILATDLDADLSRVLGDADNLVVANMWLEGQSRSVIANDVQRVSAGQSLCANGDRQQSVSVPLFPWNY